MGMNQPPIANYKNHRFPPEIIARAVWLYYRFPLSLRHVEEMLLERGTLYPTRLSADGAENMARTLFGAFAENHLPAVLSGTSMKLRCASMASDVGCGGLSIKMVVFLTRSYRTVATPRLPDVC